VSLLLVGLGFGGGYPIASSQAQQEEEPEICAFVEHFAILKRPAEITAEDLRVVTILNGLGSGKTIEKLREGVPITTLEQLDEILREAGWGKDSVMGKMLRIFFSLGGYCEVTVRSPLGNGP